MNIRKAIRADAGIAALEFALLTPLLLVLILGIADGWSLASTVLSMRAGVNTAANAYMQGLTDDASARAIALQSWRNQPGDAAVTLTRTYTCGNIVVTETTLCSGKAPSIFLHIAASATWAPPFDVDFLPISKTVTHEQVIRVR
jgi:Flp pilus assembly protein TadG